MLSRQASRTMMKRMFRLNGLLGGSKSGGLKAGSPSTGTLPEQDDHNKSGSSNESSPLVTKTQQYGGSLGAHDAPSADPLLGAGGRANESRASSKARVAWEKLANRIEAGDTLLMSHIGGDERLSNMAHHRGQSFHHRKRNQALTEIQSSLDYTLPQCLLAVLLYVAVAVVVYRFVFDNMTVIDAM